LQMDNLENKIVFELKPKIRKKHFILTFPAHVFLHALWKGEII